MEDRADNRWIKFEKTGKVNWIRAAQGEKWRGVHPTVDEHLLMTTYVDYVS